MTSRNLHLSKKLKEKIKKPNKHKNKAKYLPSPKKQTRTSRKIFVLPEIWK